MFTKESVKRMAAIRIAEETKYLLEMMEECKTHPITIAAIARAKREKEMHERYNKPSTVPHKEYWEKHKVKPEDLYKYSGHKLVIKQININIH